MKQYPKAGLQFILNDHCRYKNVRYHRCSYVNQAIQSQHLTHLIGSNTKYFERVVQVSFVVIP